MKKQYIVPESNVSKLQMFLESVTFSVSNEEYNGGGNAKKRQIDELNEEIVDDSFWSK